MKKQMFQKISIVLAALLLLTAMPLSALAEKESGAETPAAVSADTEAPAEVTADAEDPAVVSAEAEDPSVVSADDENPAVASGDTVIPEKATASDAVPATATSSDAYEDGELLDGYVSDDLPSSSAEEVPAAETSVPEEIPAAAAQVPAEIPAAVGEIPEKKKETVPADIAGTWTIDGVTSYRFEEDGAGALVLPEHEYPFSFTVEDDALTLDFESSKINQAVFNITLEGDTLTLVKEEDAGAAKFVLEKTVD